MFTWNEDDEIKKGLKIVILKGLFSQEEIAKEASADNFVKELEIDIRGECETKIGPIERLVIYPVCSLLIGVAAS